MWLFVAPVGVGAFALAGVMAGWTIDAAAGLLCAYLASCAILFGVGLYQGRRGLSDWRQWLLAGAGAMANVTIVAQPVGRAWERLRLRLYR